MVISGDTNASTNLFNAAENADVVFHDALSRTLLDPMIEVSTAAQVPVMPQIMQDVIDYHADSHSIVEGAKQAGVKQLVYYHLVPVPLIGLAQDMFMRGLPKDIILAHDLQTFDLPTNSQEIIVHGP